MNEIEQAIGQMEICKKTSNLHINDHIYDLAISALRAKQEREKGCEYCRERKPILDGLGQLQIDDTDSTLWFISQAAADDIYEDHTTIHYCPMCGRKLGENDG